MGQRTFTAQVRVDHAIVRTYTAEFDFTGTVVVTVDPHYLTGIKPMNEGTPIRWDMTENAFSYLRAMVRSAIPIKEDESCSVILNEWHLLSID